ncbi:MAG: glycosyltransferase family 1 protein [Polyangiales bacterium]
MILGIDASNIRSGGGLTHLAQLLRAARPGAQGFREVRVWCGEATGRELPRPPWLHVAHEPLLDGPLPARLAWQRVVLPRLAREVDMLLSPAATSPPSIHPQVVISQNMLPFEAAERQRYGASLARLRLMALRSMHGRAFSSADGVIFLTEYARERICAALGPAAPRRTCIVPHGVEPRFRRPPRPARPLSECTASDPLRVLYVSIVSPYKHQWRVAEAVGALRRAGLFVSAEFIGAEEDPRSVARLRESLRRVDPAGGFLTMRGPVRFDELHRHYDRAELFVFASSCENLPNILLEAMAAGLPIACSDRGPMPEVLGDAGAYFDPEDPDDIARALRELGDDPGRRERLAAAASDRAERFTWTRCADETFGFLSEVARNPTRR